MTQETLVELDQDGNEFAEKFLKYRNTIATVVVFLSLVLALILRFALGGSKAEKEFLQAQETFASWESMSSIDEALLAALTESMKTHPELSEKFGSSIAQRYLALELSEEAEMYRNYLEDKRLPIHSPYKTFAAGSYLIANGDYEAALAQTIALKEALEEVDSQGEVRAYGQDLQAFILLRLANLHQELKNSQEELAVWNELKQFLADNKTRGQVIVNHLTDQRISLHDFMESRIALLGA